jgi:hypothetical protein
MQTAVDIEHLISPLRIVALAPVGTTAGPCLAHGECWREVQGRHPTHCLREAPLTCLGNGTTQPLRCHELVCRACESKCPEAYAQACWTRSIAFDTSHMTFHTGVLTRYSPTFWGATDRSTTLLNGLIGTNAGFRSAPSSVFPDSRYHSYATYPSARRWAHGSPVSCGWVGGRRP